MIDEEDDDEILNKKRSLKKILKTLTVIGLIGLGVLFMYVGGLDQVVNMVIGFTLICIGTSILQIGKIPTEPVRQTLSLVKCKSCGAIKVRNYENGDFIFKSTGTCDKCNESMEIFQIYSVKLKKVPKNKDKLEERKKKLAETIEV